MSRFYRMHDAKPAGALPIARSEAVHWNEQGYGIFATVNRFDGPRRIENLSHIDAWAVDIDAGPKDRQRARIKESPLVPSLVVETKRGFQVYWKAKDGRAEHWNRIMLGRLVPFFGADKNARDIARILRVPGFWHLKDPQDPFLVRVVWPEQDVVPGVPVTWYPVTYREMDVVQAFPPSPEERRMDEQAAHKPAEARPVEGDTFWEKVSDLNCRDGLERLSGHSAVSGEHYSFRKNASGTFNIMVNKKSTSCWIDLNGKIGSLSEGGPTLANWLRWYGHGWATIAKTLKEVFPELTKTP